MRQTQLVLYTLIAILCLACGRPVAHCGYKSGASTDNDGFGVIEPTRTQVVERCDPHNGYCTYELLEFSAGIQAGAAGVNPCGIHSLSGKTRRKEN